MPISGGKLRKLDPKTNELTKEGYEFKVSEDPTYNQKHYEALGEVIFFSFIQNRQQTSNFVFFRFFSDKFILKFLIKIKIF